MTITKFKEQKILKKKSVQLCALLNLALGITLYLLFIYYCQTYGFVNNKTVHILKTEHPLAKIILESTLTSCGTDRMMVTVAYYTGSYL